MTPFMETLRSVVTWPSVITWLFWSVASIFSLLSALFVLALTENLKELLKQRGINRLLVRTLDKLPTLQTNLRWERLRGLWWLWLIFGVSGGAAFGLWITQSQLALTQTKLDDIKHKEQTRIGTNAALTLADAFIRAKISPALVILSSSPNNEPLRHDLRGILSGTHSLSDNRSPLFEVDPPRDERDLDAPQLKSRAERGLTIHGRNQAADFLTHVLTGGCFIIHQTGEIPSGLLTYYHRLWPELVDSHHDVTWLEIGPGFALKSPGCLDH
jgi:hypothetical protein